MVVYLWKTKLEDMNRIIIIGNGFDLAHGLNTKYEDFVLWYLKTWVEKNNRGDVPKIGDKLIDVKLKNSIFNKLCLCFESGKKYLKYNVKPSKLLERIFLSIKTKGWADFESDYYELLKELLRKRNEVKNINDEFAFLQSLLIQCLNNVQKNEIKEELVDDDIKSKMLAPFVAKDISVEAKDKWNDFIKRRLNDSELIDNIELYKPSDAESGLKNVHEFKNAYKDQIEFMGIDSIDGDALPQDMLYPDRMMLLNFNYTTTADLYMPEDPHFILNHIHGELAKPESVIFGYGDESDDEYKRLQKINDNEYLRHIKTNRYLETPNYRDLLSFIDSAPFQVCIMGHSCGLSDKTLLKTLFEHRNCVSIKPYYYVNEQGKDNYLDIVQNISRNFTNPQLMRDRVVNKTFCSPLTQKELK